MTTPTLAELKAEAARLNARIAELEGINNRVMPPPPRDEGVRILHVLNERTDGMPDLRQTEKLFSIVKPLSPWRQALHDKFDEHRPFRAFSSCFRWLANVPRTDRPNGRVALSYWNDTCRTWLRARNSVASDLDLNAMILAVFAAGDIAYCPANAQLGTVWELGIVEYGGRPADATAWRRVLAEGAAAILPPSSPARRMPPLSPVRIYGG
jgi:hypothetical protein